MTKHQANVIERFGSPAAGAVRAEPAAGTAMDGAVHAMIASCERYATAYAELRRQPIGCDPMLGPILLDVLRGIAALTGDEAVRVKVIDVVSGHALDLEE